MFAVALMMVAWLPPGTSSAILASEGADSVKAHEAALQRIGVKTDGRSLLEFFRKRTPSEDELSSLSTLVRQLGAEPYRVRENASAELVSAGRRAIPFLRQALKDADLEVVRRAERCLQQLEQSAERTAILAALRLLAVRRPSGTVETLLNYLPFADDILVEEDVLNVMAKLAMHEGQAHPALAAAVTSATPVQRAAAGLIIGRSPRPEQRNIVRALLKDTDPKVRLATAQGLISGKDRDAIPALIELLEEAPPYLAWQAEDLLCRLAGEGAPPTSLGSSEAERHRCHEAWISWWRTVGSQMNLEDFDVQQRSAGLTLIVAYTGYQGNRGKVWEQAKDGSVRWEITDVQGPIDAQTLPGGRVLIAEYNGHRVTERDREGKVLWEYKWPDRQPLGCQRLPNGNTVIACISEVREVSPEGTLVASYPHRAGTILSFQKLRNGHLVLVTYDGIVREVDDRGNEVRSFRFEKPTEGLVSVEALPGGHFLVPLTSSGRVAEFDGAGKEVRSWPMPHATAATRLANGNILACSNKEQRVAEMTPTGKVVWEERAEGRLFRVRRR
jgi:hypothetical protein